MGVFMLAYARILGTLHLLATIIDPQGLTETKNCNLLTPFAGYEANFLEDGQKRGISHQYG